MEIVFLLFIAILGACLGSFVNAVAVRLHESSSLLERSRCPQCRHVIRPQHLVPVFSWIFLGGKCVDCGKKIHVQYPIVEFVAAMIAVMSFQHHSPVTDPFAFALEMFFLIALLVPVIMDLRWQELPIEYLVGMSLLGLAWHLSNPLNAVLAAMGGYLFFALQGWVSRGKWIGKGDAWFGMMMGASLGFPGIGYALYVAYLLGAVVALVGLATRLISRRDRVPFAPALAVGTLVIIWYGPFIQNLVDHTLLGR